ncbi:MAG TPA: response regulator [Mucilaginibacter sp.]|nr:response regulator [Mucilaginibacter sp.]HVW14354.1 response regulator [Mucilaginibacter sp.]
MKTVLLIDDEPELSELLQFLFKQFHYQVVVFPATVPVAKVREVNPAIIVLDNNFRRSTDIGFCLQLKNDPETSRIPILLLSANDNLGQITRDSRADGYLEKPFDISALQGTVQKILTRPNVPAA